MKGIHYTKLESITYTQLRRRLLDVLDDLLWEHDVVAGFDFTSELIIEDVRITGIRIGPNNLFLVKSGPLTMELGWASADLMMMILCHMAGQYINLVYHNRTNQQ